MIKQTIIESFARGALGLLLGAALATGCASAGEVGEVGEEAQPGAPLESTEQVGTQQESLTRVDMVDCSICATARACCTAVNAGSYCNNFNAERCTTLDPGRQRTTKIDCLVLLRTAISAWRLSGKAPPSACRIPGE
jgi:hypothetical protein